MYCFVLICFWQGNIIKHIVYLSDLMFTFQNCFRLVMIFVSIVFHIQYTSICLVLIMLGLYFNTPIIGHKFKSMSSILSKFILQRDLPSFMTKMCFWLIKTQQKEQHHKTHFRTGSWTRVLSMMRYIYTTEKTEHIYWSQNI